MESPSPGWRRRIRGSGSRCALINRPADQMKPSAPGWRLANGRLVVTNCAGLTAYIAFSAESNRWDNDICRDLVLGGGNSVRSHEN
jgi:hypothetical protein